MTTLSEADGSPVDMFATVVDGEVMTLDVGTIGEISGSIDGFQKQSNSRFNVRVVNEDGPSGRYFPPGDSLEDQAGWGNWLLCAHDG